MMHAQSDLRAEIQRFADASASLEPSPAVRASWQRAADAVASEFIDALPAQRTFSPALPSAIAAFDHNISESHTLEQLLVTVKNAIMTSGILTAGSGHLGFIPGGGLYVGAVADHLAATLNSFTADAFGAPIAAHIHDQTVRWLADLVGYGEAAWGDITSGGSHATLTAFCVARDARGVKPRAYETTCVYLGEHTHHCCKKALDVLFGGDIVVRQVPSRDHAMDHEWLANAVESDRKNGLNPWLVVATAGSTNLGRVDSIAAIAQLSEEHRLWLHVDAAYGGMFKLCAEAAPLFDGLQKANSVVLDPHKGMFLPYGCGAVLFKDGEQLRRTFSGTGVYLQDRDGGQPRPRSAMDYSLELSRPFRSLRIWLALKVHGADVIASALSEKLLLARYAYERISAIENIVTVEAPSLSVFAFYCKKLSDDDDANARTKALLNRINSHKEAFLSSTVIEGRFVIRVAILSFRTHLATIDALVEAIAVESVA